MSIMQKQYQKILRTLMKNQNNRKCADCGEQCPVNVDTTHGIFVCASCAGIHREFGDRIKSVSMATFTQDEINLLQNQTNEDFNKIFMAKWNPQEDPLPLNVDNNRKRAFLQLKYIQKIWYSKPTNQNQNNNNNFNMNTKTQNVQNNNNFNMNTKTQNVQNNMNFNMNIKTQNVENNFCKPIQNNNMNSNTQNVGNDWTKQIQNTNSRNAQNVNNNSNEQIDLLDFDFIPQQSKVQTTNNQDLNILIDLGENQNSTQNSSRQELKSFIEEMNQGGQSNDPFNDFNSGLARTNVNNDVRYHFTQPKPVRNAFIPNYATGGFGQNMPNSIFTNYNAPNKLNYYRNYNGKPTNMNPPSNNRNIFYANGNF